MSELPKTIVRNAKKVKTFLNGVKTFLNGVKIHKMIESSKVDEKYVKSTSSDLKTSGNNI